jgi:hypothetical protein
VEGHPPPEAEVVLRDEFRTAVVFAHRPNSPRHEYAPWAEPNGGRRGDFSDGVSGFDDFRLTSPDGATRTWQISVTERLARQRAVHTEQAGPR